MYNFWPLTIAGKGDEEIQLVVLPCNGYCILKVLLYKSRFPMMDGGRMTFLPDLVLSSGKICTANNPDDIRSGSRSAAWIGIGQISYFQ